jgi:hypothetical protein
VLREHVASESVDLVYGVLRQEHGTP